VKKLLKVLFYGGIVTFFMGGLFGGYFGIVIDNLPASGIKNLLLAIRIIDPVAEPLKVLVFSLFLGVVHILFGLGVKAWWEIKRGNKKEAILGPLSWIYFIVSVLLWALTKNSANTFTIIAGYNAVLSISYMIITQGRGAKNIVMKVLTGVLSLYGLVAYLSDILSYSRLLALGLSTGIIAMVVNLIALLAKDLIPYFGWVVMIFIFIGGHIFNLVISALGSFIHSGRLQYVEFFPKFLEESGQMFSPFKKDNKYTDVQ